MGQPTRFKPLGHTQRAFFISHHKGRLTDDDGMVVSLLVFLSSYRRPLLMGVPGYVEHTHTGGEEDSCGAVFKHDEILPKEASQLYVYIYITTILLCSLQHVKYK